MSSLALISLASLSLAASKEWGSVPGTAATTLVGVGASSQDLLVAGAGDNGSGAFIEQYDGKVWHNDKLEGGLLMDAAASDKVIVGVSMLPVFVSNDNGNTFETKESIRGISQDANVFGSGSDIGLVGSFSAEKGTPLVYGVAHSPDAGSTWSVYEIPGGDVRYGSFPSQDVWYVTAGLWPMYESKSRSVSSHVTLSSSSLESEVLLNDFNATSPSSDSSGYWGSISKTVDGGKTWTEVFHTAPTDNFYFNGIACTSELHCVAVGEGATYTDNKAFVTTDGGSTWTPSDVTFDESVVSCTSVAWISDTEGWLGATSKSGRNLIGLFYKTTDGGKSYSLEQQLDNCFIMDIDSVGEAGVASCISSSGSSATVATYK